MNKKQLTAIFEKNKRRYISEWEEFLRYPSISTDPAHNADCASCAKWTANHLSRIGFKSRILATGSRPVVYAQRKGLKDKPVVLFYGHYDVQPVDPLELWKTPPFSPTLKGGRLYARGAEDNKGQVMYVLKAMETLVKAGALDCTVKILIEGEEESGSRGLSRRLKQWRKLFKADVLMVSDVSMAPDNSPTIIMGLRGVSHLTVRLTGAHHDLHSGIHGGLAPNPAQELARLISSLHNPDGSIAVKGYYDSVTPPSPLERRLANAVVFNHSLYERKTGVPGTAGEKRFTPQLRTGFRPSIDINGIHSGYGGKGTKTIIPSQAFAKMAPRLVPGQDPEECLDQIKRHLAKNCPKGLKLDFPESSVAGCGFRLNPRSSLIKKAERTLRLSSGRKVSFLWEGASIPVISALAKVSGAEPLLVGFGSEEGRAHAPNESFSIDQFRDGYLYSAMMLMELGSK